MSFEDCIAEIRAAAGEGAKALSDRDIEKMLDAVTKRAKRRAIEAGTPLPDYRAAGREIAGEQRIAAAVAKRNALQNLMKRAQRRDRIAAAPDLETGLMAEIHKTNTGDRFSAEGEWHTRMERYAGGMLHELERAGLDGAVRRGTLDREWARELYELSKGEDGKPGVSGSPEALAIARIVHKWQTQAKTDMNHAGAWVGDYQGYVARTVHDPDKIRLASEQQYGWLNWRTYRPRPGASAADRKAWTDFARTVFDERTFEYVSGEGKDGVQRFLNNVYSALVSGVHIAHEGPQGFKDPAFTGPANLAERVSHERVLHFKNADAWMDYRERFGRGGALIGDVLTGLNHAARATALMARWGTNPRAEFAADLRYFAEERRESDPDLAKRLNRQAQDGGFKSPLWNRFNLLDGTANRPVNMLGAKIGSTLRLDETLAKLGNILFTHLSAGMTRAAELKHHGVGFLESYGDYLASVVRGPRGHGETRELLDLIHAGMDGALRELHEAAEPNDSLPGVMASLANKFFKYALFTRQFNSWRTGAQYLLARHLGGLLDTAWGDLPAETRGMLGRFRVDEREWRLLAGAPERATLRGRDFLTPDLATRIPDAAALGHLYELGRTDNRILGAAANQRRIAAFRDDLAQRLHAYLNDTADRAMITPGIRERATLLQGSNPGTIVGEGLRFFAQFKTWPTALVYQGLGREINLSPGKAAAFAGVLHMALAGAAFGYVRMAAADFAAGRDPRDPLSPATWIAALAQGGGLGIMGDFLFGEYDRMGGGWTSALAGPVLGAGLTAVSQIYNEAKAGHNPSAEAFRLVLNQAPFLNIFYLRLALNYLFLWQLQEQLSPGYLRRFERRAKTQNRQNFWLSPTARIPSHAAPRPRPAQPQPWGWLK